MVGKLFGKCVIFLARLIEGRFELDGLSNRGHLCQVGS
jgi:hypothetical protein